MVTRPSNVLKILTFKNSLLFTEKENVRLDNYGVCICNFKLIPFSEFKTNDIFCYSPHFHEFSQNS